MRDHSTTAGLVRSLQLARRPGQLRDQSDRPEPTDREGADRRCAKGDGKGSINSSISTPTTKLSDSRLQPLGIAHDKLRLLRVHCRGPAVANGVMIVNREYAGMTPCGHDVRRSGFGHGRRGADARLRGRGPSVLSSPKFLAADGGMRRIVWMPKSLKEAVRERLQVEAERIGDPGLLDKIATEENGVTEEEVIVHLEAVGHPALGLPPLICNAAGKEKKRE